VKSVDSEAQQLTLEELQKGLNTTDETKLQKGTPRRILRLRILTFFQPALKLFNRRMELEPATETSSLLSQYITSSPHCQELLTIWDLMFQQDRAKTFSSAQLLETMATLIKQSTSTNAPSANWRAAIELSRKAPTSLKSISLLWPNRLFRSSASALRH